MIRIIHQLISIIIIITTIIITTITIIIIIIIISNLLRWTIKARITAKSELRRWSNAKGEGTLFSIDLLDNMGGEIKGTFFKDACDKFFPVLEEGKV
jgi:replication factor A1